MQGGDPPLSGTPETVLASVNHDVPDRFHFRSSPGVDLSSSRRLPVHVHGVSRVDRQGTRRTEADAETGDHLLLLSHEVGRRGSFSATTAPKAKRDDEMAIVKIVCRILPPVNCRYPFPLVAAGELLHTELYFLPACCFFSCFPLIIPWLSVGKATSSLLGARELENSLIAQWGKLIGHG